jgi:hypothetical protein
MAAETPVVAQRQAETIASTAMLDDGGAGFTARNSTDFFGNSDLSDFLPDNELRLSDEIYAQYEETLGERVARENRPAIDALAKLEDTLSGL